LTDFGLAVGVVVGRLGGDVKLQVLSFLCQLWISKQETALKIRLAFPTLLSHNRNFGKARLGWKNAQKFEVWYFDIGFMLLPLYGAWRLMGDYW
jgi:hypothetical protein